jgi:hypothetical protein
LTLPAIASPLAIQPAPSGGALPSDPFYSVFQAVARPNCAFEQVEQLLYVHIMFLPKARQVLPLLTFIVSSTAAVTAAVDMVAEQGGHA